MDTKQLFKNAQPHLISIAFFLAIVLAYFSPTMSGKVLQQGDITQHKGMAQEIRDYNADHDDCALWTNSMFGGMPAYQVALYTDGNLVGKTLRTLKNYSPINRHPLVAFLGLICGYILLLVLGVSPIMAAIGSFAFIFSTYSMLIVEAGHNSKFETLCYTPLMLAGVLLTYKKRYLLGAALTALGFALSLVAGHPQITYYFLLALMIYFGYELYHNIKEKTLPHFLKATAILGGAFLLGAGTYTTNLWTTYEYSKYTIRGGAVLEGDANSTSNGLDKDYALAWSYGKMETMTLLAPRFYGGGSGQQIDKNYAAYKMLKRGRGEVLSPTYWGAQPFTGGPVYHGAVIGFLFFLGCFLVKGRLKWWLVSATILSILLSWGSNLEWFTDLFFYYFPMYNKFRVVSMILVIAQLTMPVLGVMALHQILTNEISKDEVWKWLKIVGGALAGVLLLFAFLGSGFFDFESAKDANYPKQLIDALTSDRMMMMRNDCLRALGFMLVTGGVIWAYINQKLKNATVAGLVIGALVVADFWSINKLYLNEADFVSKKKHEKTYTPSSADQQIQQDSDPNFRVLNTSVNTFNDATTSYYHKSIGGYHGAKLRRYQDIIERHISQNNVNVMNMLNTKYIIGGGREGNPPVAQRNPGALGNAWFVNNIKNVATANEEIDALTDFNPRQTAIVHQEFNDYVGDIPSGADSTASIRLTSYSPNVIEYNSQSKGTNLAVFSEIHYPKGWNAYIDGQATDHIRTNYLLRGLKVPAGNHKIEFKFEPTSYHTGETIALICSSLLMLGLLGYFGTSVYQIVKQ